MSACTVVVVVTDCPTGCRCALRPSRAAVPAAMAAAAVSAAPTVGCCGPPAPPVPNAGGANVAWEPAPSAAWQGLGGV
eukprot:11205846-Lingulodinium_polyedra.AAC.1